MKFKSKTFVTSSLVLALSLSIINPAMASDENDMKSDVSIEETSVEKNDNQKKDSVYCKINLYVKNRRVKDWLKKGSYYKIDDLAASQLNENYDTEKSVIRLDLIPGEKHKIQILEGKDGKAYANGEINIIADAEYGHEMDVEIIPNTPIKTRKMTLIFKDKQKKEDRMLPNGKNYLFVDNKFIDEYNKDKNGSYHFDDFEYETGKKFKIEFRRTDKPNSELLASIEDEMPEDGKMVDSKSKDVYLKFPTDKEDEKDSKKDDSKGKNTNSPSTETSSNDDKKDSKNTENKTKPLPKTGQVNESSNPSSNTDNKDNQKPSNIDKDKKNPSTENNGGTISNPVVTPIDNSNNDNEKTSDESYKTRQEAIDAAKKEMEKDPSWKSYQLIEQKDGTFKYVLSKEEDKDKLSNKNNSGTKNTPTRIVGKAEDKIQKPKNLLNVNTGVKGVGAVIGVLALALIGFFVTKHKK